MKETLEITWFSTVSIFGLTIDQWSQLFESTTPILAFWGILLPTIGYSILRLYQKAREVFSNDNHKAD